MTKECLWYNGEVGCYELMEFDPNGLKKKEVIDKAAKILKRQYGFDNEAMQKALETLYLINIKHLIKVIR